MDKRWTTNSSSIYNISYHIIWCPKYRRKVLINGVDIRLKELLNEKANVNGWTIKSMEVMADHVHLFIQATPSDSVSHIVGQLKGYSSRKLREEFPFLKMRLSTLWTRSFYVETIGHISQATVEKYIEDQKKI